MHIRIKKFNNAGALSGESRHTVSYVRIRPKLVEFQGGNLKVPLYVRHDDSIDIVIMEDRDAEE